jgi:hypothetical protein
MFLLYHSEGCNICELVLHECYVNDLYTTTCSGMQGHHNYLQPFLKLQQKKYLLTQFLPSENLHEIVIFNNFDEIPLLNVPPM